MYDLLAVFPIDFGLNRLSTTQQPEAGRRHHRTTTGCGLIAATFRASRRSNIGLLHEAIRVELPFSFFFF
jgi:hypothetical protein